MYDRFPLNALKYFYYSAHLGSVTQAANRLYVTQSAVTKQIQNLESILDTQLFNKSGRQLILTVEGERLYACCEKIFTQLEECLSQLKSTHDKQRQLILSCEPTLSMKWLIPRLLHFNEAQHGFEIVLLTGGGRVNFEEKNIDLAIRRNDFEWDSPIFAEKLADEYVAAVSAPKRDVATDVPLIVTASRPNLLKHLKKGNLLSKELLSLRKKKLEHFYLSIEAAIAGLGISVVSPHMIDKEIQDGVLKYDSPPVPDGSAYYLLSRTPYEDDERKRIFLAWLKKEFGSANKRLAS